MFLAHREPAMLEYGTLEPAATGFHDQGDLETFGIPAPGGPLILKTGACCGRRGLLSKALNHLIPLGVEWNYQSRTWIPGRSKAANR